MFSTRFRRPAHRNLRGRQKSVAQGYARRLAPPAQGRKNQGSAGTGPALSNVSAPWSDERERRRTSPRRDLNVHWCRGIDGRRSEARIADVIAALQADVVGLQELDLNRLRSTGVAQAGLIAEYLGWHHYFHAAMRKGDEHYGDAILSRYPMRLRQARELPSVMTRICPEIVPRSGWKWKLPAAKSR